MSSTSGMTKLPPAAESLSVGPARRSPGRTVAVVAVIIALLAGAVTGFLVGRSLSPSETVTKTVTRTVPPPAYSTGEFSVAVDFDGAACMFNGPAEQPAGSRFGFNYTGVEGSSLIIWRVSPGTPYEEVVRSAFLFGAGVYADLGPYVSAPTGAREQKLAMTLDEGLWMVGCTRHPRSGRQVFTATMLRVVAGR
jgi:hypothetical protein